MGAKTDEQGVPRPPARVQRYLDFCKAVNQLSSNLYSFLERDTEDFRFLRVKESARGFVAVAGRRGPTGEPQVCFADGSSPLEALATLGSSMASEDNWRADKYT